MDSSGKTTWIYWVVFITDLEVSWQKPFLRKAEKLNLVITESKLSKWRECRIIFYLSTVFLHLGGLIKLVNVNKMFSWSFKTVFLKNYLNEQKRRGETSCWSCHFQTAELWIWNNKIETYKTATWQLYSMYSRKGNIFTNTVEEDVVSKSETIPFLVVEFTLCLQQ